MHDLPVVLGGVLAVGLVQAYPDGVPDVEGQHAVSGVELPQAITAFQQLVREPEGDLWPRHTLIAVLVLLGRIGDDARPPGARLSLTLRLIALLLLLGQRPWQIGDPLREDADQPMSHGREDWAGGEALHDLGQRLFAELLVALFAACLVLVFVQRLAAVQVPGADRHVETVESLAEPELRPCRVELDVLGVDHAFEVARTECVERLLDMLELLTPHCLGVELPPGHRRIIASPHDADLSATLAASLTSPVELEGNCAALLTGVADDFQRLAGVVLGVDVPFVEKFAAGADHGEVDGCPLRTHADLELRADQVFQVVEIHLADDSVVNDPFDPDHGAPGSRAFGGQFQELIRDLRQSVLLTVWDIGVVMLNLDLVADERPDVGLASLLTARDVRLTCENELLALVERGYQAQAETTKAPRLLDAPADTVQSLLELLFRDTFAVVERDDQVMRRVDTDEHRLGRRVDGVLNGLDDRERQRRVLVGQPHESLSHVQGETLARRPCRLVTHATSLGCWLAQSRVG